MICNTELEKGSQEKAGMLILINFEFNIFSPALVPAISILNKNFLSFTSIFEMRSCDVIYKNKCVS